MPSFPSIQIIDLSNDDLDIDAYNEELSLASAAHPHLFLPNMPALADEIGDYRIYVCLI